jgi:hypothetical protein
MIFIALAVEPLNEAALEGKSGVLRGMGECEAAERLLESAALLNERGWVRIGRDEMKPRAFLVSSGS